MLCPALSARQSILARESGAGKPSRTQLRKMVRTGGSCGANAVTEFDHVTGTPPGCA